MDCDLATDEADLVDADLLADWHMQCSPGHLVVVERCESGRDHLSAASIATVRRDR
jgi:hypothetical protein